MRSGSRPLAHRLGDLANANVDDTVIAAVHVHGNHTVIALGRVDGSCSTFGPRD